MMFLHSNATSHKWALEAELLGNSLDEVRTAATYVKIDVVNNKKDACTKMLLIEDNGGGMNPDKMREYLALGYFEKSKMANTIGQYGNCFKTSTIRLGADVLVFTRNRGQDFGRKRHKWQQKNLTQLKEHGFTEIYITIVPYGHLLFFGVHSVASKELKQSRYIVRDDFKC